MESVKDGGGASPNTIEGRWSSISLIYSNKLLMIIAMVEESADAASAGGGGGV